MFSARTAFDDRPNPLSQAIERLRDEAQTAQGAQGAHAGDATSGARAADAAKRRGVALLDLTVANPTTVNLPYARAAILSALSDARALTYEPLAFGLPSARAAIADAYAARGFAIDPANILLTASTSEAYAYIFKLLCDPGDELLAPAPSYPLFEHLARFESVHLVPYPLRYDGSWHVDLAALRSRIGPRTRGILLVSPNNPTGSYTKREELTALAALGLPLVSDEVFAGYPLAEDRSGTRAWSALETSETLVFALGGLSKAAALPQMKLAWTIVQGQAQRVAEARARLELIADSFLSAGTPVQHALPALLTAGRDTESAIRERTARNLATLDARLSRPAEGSTLGRLHVEGGWYATLRLPRTRSEAEWAMRFLTEDRVIVHPGHFFDFEDEAYVVVSLLAEEPDFAEAVERIASRVEREA